MKNRSPIFFAWLPFAVTIVGLCALVYATVLQNYRQSLDDPQIQLAQDAASFIDRGAKPETIVPNNQTNIAESLAPWIAVYDASGNPIASSGVLDGTPPKPPQGVFTDLGEESAESKNVERRLSWQPQPGVRQAIVIVKTDSGFVVTDRNMREVEERIGQLSQTIFIAMILLLAATLGAIYLRNSNKS